MTTITRRAVIAHPSPELYGSDRQLLETSRALVDSGWDVTVCLPSTGPLAALLQEQGARVLILAFPVLRRAVLTPGGFIQHAAASLRALARIRRLLAVHKPDLVLVNTITIPVWLAATRLSPERRVTVCHVHEAEQALPLLAQRVLTSPLRLARGILANSRTTRDAIIEAVPSLAPRIKVLHNGVVGPSKHPDAIRERRAGDPLRALVVGRLSPRKGTMTALEVAATARAHGLHVELTLCGSVFEGYEWFEAELRERAAQPDLAGSVTFAGYAPNIWKYLAETDVALMPTRGESFGNAAVEAMHARRPLIASGVQGLQEIVQDGVTGLLFDPDDVRGMADALGKLADSPEEARRIADNGWRHAHEQFTIDRYHGRIAELLSNFVEVNSA